jgi:hypothetical protein
MAAEAHDQSQRALGHEVQAVAQVKARDGASGTAQFPRIAPRKAEHRPVQPLA